MDTLKKHLSRWSILTLQPLFFAALAFIAVLATNGCTSTDSVEPLEETPGDEELYFWGGMYGDEKIYLNLDRSRRLYRLENTADADGISSELKSLLPGLSTRVMQIGKYAYLLASKENTAVSFPDSEKVKFQVPVYISKKTGFTYFFDGGIILKPKTEAKIDEILKLETELNLAQILSSGTGFFYVEDGNKVLTIANRIYESGLVEFSYPNYIPPAVRLL